MLSREILSKPVAGAVTREKAIADYRTAFRSRVASLLGRREVLTGKAKFGIFGDGKELPQIAMARVFRNGDWRSGYYRDQTFALASGMVTLKQFFAQLYANPDIEADPHSGGRQMNSHFATRILDENGDWRRQIDMPNTTADLSPTASQMPRLAGLVQASRLYRNLPYQPHFEAFTQNGEEIAFGIIGNASCAEGHFWETLNAIGVIQGPLIMSIWDDEYGISVPNEYQLTKSSLSDMLRGFQRTEQERGFEILTVNAWDYEALLKTYRHAEQLARYEHVPVVVHVREVTQPLGHSTSGSHERYKTPARLEWERDHDCVKKMREYLTETGFASVGEIEQMEEQDRKQVIQEKQEAWRERQQPLKNEASELLALATQLSATPSLKDAVHDIALRLRSTHELSRREILSAAQQLLILGRKENSPVLQQLKAWRSRRQ
ncbi:MAG: transketolase, partial [Bacteroidetes bacterium]